MVERPTCPVCGQPAGETLLREPYLDSRVGAYVEAYYREAGRYDPTWLEGAVFDVRRCSCGMIWQAQIPNDAFMHELYEGWLDPEWAFRVDWCGDMARRQFTAVSGIASILRRIRKPTSEVRVLDAGMGWGRWLLAARALGCRAYGVELSPRRITFAQSQGIAILEWGALAGMEFDVINCDQVLEHIPDPVAVLSKLASCLARGGIMRLGVPNATGVERALARFDWTLQRANGSPQRRVEIMSKIPIGALVPLQHINAFKPRVFRDLIRRAGCFVQPPSVRADLETWSFRAGGLRAIAKLAVGALRREAWGNTVLAVRARE